MRALFIFSLGMIVVTFWASALDQREMAGGAVFLGIMTFLFAGIITQVNKINK